MAWLIFLRVSGWMALPSVETIPMLSFLYRALAKRKKPWSPILLLLRFRDVSV